MAACCSTVKPYSTFKRFARPLRTYQVADATLAFGLLLYCRKARARFARFSSIVKLDAMWVLGQVLPREAGRLLFQESLLLSLRIMQHVLDAVHMRFTRNPDRDFNRSPLLFTMRAAHHLLRIAIVGRHGRDQRPVPALKVAARAVGVARRNDRLRCGLALLDAVQLVDALAVRVFSPTLEETPAGPLGQLHAEGDMVHPYDPRGFATPGFSCLQRVVREPQRARPGLEGGLDCLPLEDRLVPRGHRHLAAGVGLLELHLGVEVATAERGPNGLEVRAALLHPLFGRDRVRYVAEP